MSKITKIEIIVKGIHRNVGFFDYESSTYYTKRQTKNIFKSFYGFGVSMPILLYMEEEKINNIVILCNGEQFKTTLLKYCMKGFEHSDGNDKQLILPIYYFETMSREPRIKVYSMPKQTKENYN